MICKTKGGNWKKHGVPLGDEHLILIGSCHFSEINILTLSMLKINNRSSSEKKINNLTVTFLEQRGKVQIFLKIVARFARNS